MPVPARPLAVVGAVAAAVLVQLVGDPLLGVDLVFAQDGQEPRDVGTGAVALFAAVAALLGWALLALLERFAPARARTAWTATALVVLPLSMLSMLPVLDVEATRGARAVLALTHGAVGAVLIPLPRRTARPAAAPVPAEGGA